MFPPSAHQSESRAADGSIQSADERGLRRILGLRDLVVIVIGTVMGSGIFLVPGVILRQVGNSVIPAMAVWLSGGVLSLLGALTYGELSAVKPNAGGLYIYIRDCFGPFLAFLFGWTFFLVISSGAVATLAVAFSNYLSEFLPLGRWGAKLVSVLLIGLIAALNVRGTRQSANVLNLATAIKVLAVLAMSTALIWFGKNPVLSSPHAAGWSVSGFGLAMISALWAYEGWQYATFSAGEAVNARRNYPIAFLIATADLMFIYLFANVGYLAALGAEGVARSDRVAATAVAAVIHPAAAKLVALTILISIFSAANSVMLTSPRVYYAMARDGLFFRRVAEVHSRFGTPAFAVLAAAFWSAILAASGTFEQLLTFVVFIGWSFYAVAAACIFVYRKRNLDVEAAYKVPGYPFTPALFILAVAGVVVNTIVNQPLRAAIGLGIVLIGAPVYFVWRGRSRL